LGGNTLEERKTPNLPPQPTALLGRGWSVTFGEKTMNRPRKDHYAFELTKAPAKTEKTGDALVRHETVTAFAEGEGRFVLPSEGKGGQYGHVVVKIEPNGRHKGIEVAEDSVVGIPKEFIQSARDGVREGLANGVIGGYPVVDVLVRIVGGSSHPTDSSELAFKMAGVFAIKEALKKAKPVLLR
jgi:Elongation factor G, domain IV